MRLAIQHFDAAKYWERSLDLIKELRTQYQREIKATAIDSRSALFKKLVEISVSVLLFAPHSYFL